MRMVIQRIMCNFASKTKTIIKEERNTTMKKEDLRIVFMGTPEFAVETLKRLVEGGYNVVGVVTQPDKPVGRHGSVLRAPAVKEYALQKGLPVLQPEKMKDPQFVEALDAWNADLQVVVAFRMLPEVVWAMPSFGTFNVHAALLPRYRGAAPINWAIINGEKKTGVTTFFLDHDIDTGRIIKQKEFDIPDDADVEYVYDGLMTLGAELALETVDAIIENDGDIASIPQDDFISTTDEATLPHAPKIFKETCEIDWNNTAKNIYNFIRGLSPIPAAWTTLYKKGEEKGDGIVLKIYKTAKTGLSVITEKPEAAHTPGAISIEKGRLMIAANDEWLEIVELQMAGKKRMSARDFLNGFHNLDHFFAE